MKKSIFFLFPTSITFLLLMVTNQPYLLFQTLMNQSYHISKSPSIPKHILKVWTPNQKFILFYGKVKETYFTSVKKSKILSFLGTKKCLTEEKNQITNLNLDILNAVCLSFDWVRKLFHKNCQTMEQNLFSAVRLRLVRMLARPHT